MSFRITSLAPSRRRSLTAGRRRQSLRKSFERLEDRRLLAVVSWDGGGNDLNWNNALNWDTNQLPGPTDDVLIATSSSTPAVNLANSQTTIKSLSSSVPLNLSNQELTVVSGSASVAGLSASNSTIYAGGGMLLTGSSSCTSPDCEDPPVSCTRTKVH